VTGPTETAGQYNARKSAQSYLKYSSFSRTGLINQLLYEGFSSADATYGTDAQNADWNVQASKTALSYLKYSSFSRSGLIGQLLYEGFTQAQAEYGVSTTGL
jgi:SOS response regulatory protein OraA/RecX